MTSADLAQYLGITAERLAEFVAAGLPVRADGTFEESAVAGWLVEHGHARHVTPSPPHPLTPSSLKTLAEIAAHRQVSERVIATWRKEGLPRPPVSREAVDLWAAANGKRPIGGKRGGGSEGEEERLALQNRKLAAEVGLAELKLAERQRTVVAVAEVLLIVAYIETAKVILEALPDRLLPLLGKGESGEGGGGSKAAFLTAARAVVADVCLQLSDASAELGGQQSAISGQPEEEPKP